MYRKALGGHRERVGVVLAREIVVRLLHRAEEALRTATRVRLQGLQTLIQSARFIEPNQPEGVRCRVCGLPSNRKHCARR